jgi:hypothetical protein
MAQLHISAKNSGDMQLRHTSVICVYAIWRKHRCSRKLKKAVLTSKKIKNKKIC